MLIKFARSKVCKTADGHKIYRRKNQIRESKKAPRALAAAPARAN
ncbi:hypothetical protein CAMGR0001_2824 [Campylobacter gracilis RM3268]|uniref:50S ribosomal protein L36 n=1 Tax=Campylobacter gracilis RM3268 TaxID=553220 RepID=C8PL33_9BACT|nr:hypothetical protein CAMGR0001_2824 [Campylobacter gracilis RM3268]